jgi:hypothetical protein
MNRPGGGGPAAAGGIPARFAVSGWLEIAAAVAVTGGRAGLRVHTAVCPGSWRVTGCELLSPPSTAIAWPLM